MENESKDQLTIVKLQGRTFILVGTAHVSEESVKEVRAAIEEYQPERVCIEIDENRYKMLKENLGYSHLDIFQVLKQRKSLFILANLALSSFQKKIGLDLGTKPGQEMMEAVQVAEENQLPVTLADRDVQITLKRAWAKAGFFTKMKLISALLTSVVSSEEISSEEIEKLKKKTAIEGMMDELADYLPSVKQVLIDERDQYLAGKIYETNEKSVLAVVGAGHVPGIIKHLQAQAEEGEKIDYEAIEKIPPTPIIYKILPWVVPFLVAGIIISGFFVQGLDLSLKMLLIWVLANGIPAALGALIALAHPLTILISFVAAPITSMNPTIGVGFVSGFLEAFFRKPKVEDLEVLQQDILTVKGFFRNRFTHVLLVFILSSVGSSLGTLFAVPYLSVLLGINVG